MVDVKDRNRQVKGQPSRRWIWLDFYSSVATAKDFRREAKKKKNKRCFVLHFFLSIHSLRLLINAAVNTRHPAIRVRLANMNREALL